MYQRLFKPLLSKSFFLFGARGTGKTRLLHHIFDLRNCLWIDLLKEGELFTYLKNPQYLGQQIEASSEPPEWVVIDEVQRAPSLLNEVHFLIEQRRGKFALTGSSARKLKRGGANLLAGRAIVNSLFPLTHLELGADFSLESAIAWGTLPLLCTEGDETVRKQALISYVDTYLREEIREEQIVRRLDPFARFLEVAAQSSGSIINLSRMGREAGTDARTISRYYQILEETLLGFFLEPYHASIRKRQRSLSKFYLFDLGVKRALDGTLRVQPERKTYSWGQLFEQFIVLEAIRLNSYFHADYRFSYLRTQSQLEVDIIAERAGDRTWVVEVKSSEDPDIVDIRKLKSLADSIPNSRPALFCDCSVARIVENVEIFPWKEGFLKMFEITAPTLA